MARWVLRFHAPHSTTWHWARGLVMVWVAATGLLAACGRPMSGVRGEPTPPSLPYTIAHLSPLQSGAVREFRLPPRDSTRINGYMSGLVSLTSGPDGALWFGEDLGGRIGRLTPSGMLTEFLLPRVEPDVIPLPESLTVGPDGALWFTINELYLHLPKVPDRVGRLTISGILTQFPLPPTFQPTGQITTGPDGALWMSGLRTQTGEPQIARLTLTGTLTEFDIPRDRAPAGVAASPYGIVAGPDGALWFTTAFGVGRMTPTGTFTWPVVKPELQITGGITVGADGNLWFTEPLSNRVGRLTPSGSLTEFPLPKHADLHPDTPDPFAITRGQDGNVWFTERYASTIGRITPSGVLTEFPLPLSLLPIGAPGTDDLTDITAGPDGAIWFIQQQANAIGRLSF